MQATIRIAQLDDAEAIAQLDVNEQRATYAGILPQMCLDALSYESEEAKWRRRLTEGAAHYLIVVAQDALEGVIGFAAVGVATGSEPAYLESLYVRSTFPHMGIGSRLLRKVAQELIGRRKLGMSCLVYKANEPADKFFKRMGGDEAIPTFAPICGVRVETVKYEWKDVGQTLLAEMSSTPKAPDDTSLGR